MSEVAIGGGVSNLQTKSEVLGFFVTLPLGGGGVNKNIDKKRHSMIGGRQGQAKNDSMTHWYIAALMA